MDRTLIFLLSIPALVQAAPEPTADPAFIKARVEALFQEGLAHYQAGRFREALPKFDDAFLAVDGDEGALPGGHGCLSAGRLWGVWRESGAQSGCFGPTVRGVFGRVMSPPDARQTAIHVAATAVTERE